MLVKPYDPPSPIVNHLYGWFMTLLYYALLTIWNITTFHWWFNYQWAMFNRKLTSKKRLRVFEPLKQQLFLSSKRREGFPAVETKLRLRWSWLRDFFVFWCSLGTFSRIFLGPSIAIFCFWYLLFFFALIVQRFCFFASLLYCLCASLLFCFCFFLLFCFSVCLLLCFSAVLLLCFFTVLNALVCIYIHTYIYIYISFCIYIYSTQNYV